MQPDYMKLYSNTGQFPHQQVIWVCEMINLYILDKTVCSGAFTFNSKPCQTQPFQAPQPGVGMLARASLSATGHTIQK